MTRQPPVSRVGDYHVLDFVGAGGMGEVYRAVHVSTGQVVAAKFLGSGARDSRGRARFAHEARVQQGLRHPGLAAFYEWHEVNGVPCIVMEFVDGETLAERLSRVGALPLSEALTFFERIAAAIAWMHEREIIHRDIKSSNIKINSRGEIKLLDFGIARNDEAPHLTQTGAFIGTLHYLAPEQIRGALADARSDVWAMGVLFYEMLTGRAPFQAATAGEVLEKVGRARYARLSEVRPDVPRTWEAAVRRCLQRNPRKRFANAGEVRAELNRLGGAQQVAAPAPAIASSPHLLRMKAQVLVPVGIGGLLLITLLAWNSTRLPEKGQQTALADVQGGQPTKPELDDEKPRDASASGEERKTIIVDVFEGAAQTKVWRDGENLGRPPVRIEARLNDEVRLSLRRKGFHTRYETITITNSQRVYSFSLEPLS